MINAIELTSNFPVCLFSDVTERDMDLLFLEEFVCSRSFLQIFTDMVGIKDAKVLSIHSSKTDVSLGESDMTVIVEENGEKIGLLIENKIDAHAMPEQCERYKLRGQKGVKEGDFVRFFLFITAPKLYLGQNAEAQKYPNKVEYETILSYFEKLNDERSPFKIQQIKQAIEKQKKGYQVEVDHAVTDFWGRYSALQKASFPDLQLLYNGEFKGARATWPRYNTAVDGLYMYHKTEVGYIDLTFENCADKVVKIEELLTEAVGDYRNDGFTVHITKKSAAIRLNVPALDFHKSFDEQFAQVMTCFAAIEKMANTAKKLRYKYLYEILTKKK